MSFVPNSIIINSIILENFKGEQVEISDLMKELNIYESIYQNTISGSLEMIDSMDMIQFFPIIGEEKIYIDLVMPGDDEGDAIELKFSVYRISDRVIRSDKVQNYILWFASEELIKNAEQKVSRSWQGVPVSKIVNEVMNNYIKSSKKTNIETTHGMLNYIAPAMNPFRVINYLASARSINESRLADFVFFENLTATGSQFNFVSLGSLSLQKPIASLSYHQTQTAKKGSMMVYPLNIESIEFKKSIDVLESKSAGLFNQTFLFYDHLRKQSVMTKTKHAEIFNDTKSFHLEGDNSAPMYYENNQTPMEFFRVIYVDEFPANASSAIFDNSVNKTANSTPKRKDISYIGSNGEASELNAGTLKEKVVARRAVLLQEYENNKIYLNDISGNLSYTVGKIIDLDLPHIVANRDGAVAVAGQNENQFISGNYLITKCRHRILKHQMLNYEYKCHLEVAKNAFKAKFS